MDQDSIKGVIARHWPCSMTYVKARRLKVNDGRWGRTYSRVVGLSSDNLLSVELVGPPRKLVWCKFMIGLNDAERVPLAAQMVAACALNSGKNANEEVIVSAMSEMRDCHCGDVRIKIVGVGGINIAFVKI